jgi:hypothetical protein
VTIFVSVASYRDPELVPTVLDCLAKAARPDELRVVVNWQHRGGLDGDVSAIAGLPQVTVLDRDARDSRGACWARAQVMAEYRGEDWYLQVDSHTRFAMGFDVRLVELAERTKAPKPVLSCYPPAYEPASAQVAGVPSELYCDGWTGDGLPILAQRTIEGWQHRDAPVPARFVAAGFLFAPGSFASEVPYDPDIYFQGEEPTLSARAWTWGYDLFHPAEVLSWHHYLRTDSPRHWDDAQTWSELDRLSRRRVATLLRYPSVGRFAMGPARPMSAYQDYAGIDFRARTLDPAPLRR